MSYTQRVYHGEPFKGRGSFNWFFNPGIVHSDSVVVITASEYQPEVVPPTTRMSASALRVTRTSGFPISVLTGKGHPTSACSTPSTSTFSIRCSWLSTSPCSIRRESRPSTSNSEGRLSLATLMRWLRSSSCKNRIYRVFREVGRSVRAVALLRYLADPRQGAKVDYRRDSNEHRTSAPCRGARGDNVA